MATKRGQRFGGQNGGSICWEPGFKESPREPKVMDSLNIPIAVEVREFRSTSYAFGF